MPTQIQDLTPPQRQTILTTSTTALTSFHASTSPSSFRIISTISDAPTTLTTLVHQNPATLFILDSSFNPPTLAHAALAVSAVAAARTGARDARGRLRYPGPVRVMLLFSTHNADKNGSQQPAAFEHRLGMMIVFARDLKGMLAEELRRGDGSRGQASEGLASDERDMDMDMEVPDIDIALTTEPYYHAKSAAIEAHSDSNASLPASYPTELNPRPTTKLTSNKKTRHIHLVGYDTITRIFTPRYYPKHSPPLSALAPFFARHGLRATVRMTSANEKAVPESETQKEKEGQAEREKEANEQLSWPTRNLASGHLAPQGGQAEWANRIEMVEAVRSHGVGAISSSRVRGAVAPGEWGDVELCCSGGVVGWIREFGLYT